MHIIHAATSRVENLAEASTCQLACLQPKVYHIFCHDIIKFFTVFECCKNAEVNSSAKFSRPVANVIIFFYVIYESAKVVGVFIPTKPF